MILVLDCGSAKAQRIAEILDDDIDAKVIPFFDLDPVQLRNYSGLVISGSRLLVTEHDVTSYIAVLEKLKTFDKPVLGIAFGHHMISLASGGFAIRTRTIQDLQLIESFEECALLDNLPSEFEMMEDHRESVSVPPEFKLIASSDDCVNEVMQHSNKPIFGVQFHPEASGNFGATLLGNFARLCLKEDHMF